MDRQFTLERLGWKFVRLRASEYMREPDKVLKRLVRRLRQVGIEPQDPAAEVEPAAPVEDELTQRVVKRAEMIRLRWKEPEIAVPVAAAPDAEADSDTSAGPDASE